MPPTASDRGSFTTTRTWSNPTTAARVSGELGRFLFWIHEVSGPIALGILTMAVAVAAVWATSPRRWLWRSWIGSKWL